MSGETTALEIRQISCTYRMITHVREILVIMCVCDGVRCFLQSSCSKSRRNKEDEQSDMKWPRVMTIIDGNVLD